MVSKAWLKFTSAHLEFIEGRGFNFTEIVADLYQG